MVGEINKNRTFRNKRQYNLGTYAFPPLCNLGIWQPAKRKKILGPLPVARRCFFLFIQGSHHISRFCRWVCLNMLRNGIPFLGKSLSFSRFFHWQILRNLGVNPRCSDTLLGTSDCYSSYLPFHPHDFPSIVDDRFPHHQAVHHLEAALQGVEPTEEELTFVMKMAGEHGGWGWNVPRIRGLVVKAV